MKRLTYLHPHKTALTCAIVSAIGSLFFIIPTALLTLFIPTANHPVNTKFSGSTLLIMPVFYFIFGYISTAFFAWLYNQVAKFTGGIAYKESNQQDS